MQRLECRGQCGSPRSIVIFEGVVELAADKSGGKLCEGGGKGREIVAERRRRIRINDEAGRTWGGAFDFHFRRGAREFAVQQSQFGRTILGRDPRTTERPAGACGHIHAESQTLRFMRGVGQHFHPAGR